jgi:hypothetical protein
MPCKLQVRGNLGTAHSAFRFFLKSAISVGSVASVGRLVLACLQDWTCPAFPLYSCRWANANRTCRTYASLYLAFYSSSHCWTGGEVMLAVVAWLGMLFLCWCHYFSRSRKVQLQFSIFEFNRCGPLLLCNNDFFQLIWS